MKLQYIAFLACIIPDLAAAQVYLCNGKWTTTACPGVKPLTGEQRSVLKPAEAQALSRKRSLLHELTMKNLSAREEFDIRIDVSSVEEYCSRKEVSVEACRIRVEETDDRLDQRINSVRLIRAQEEKSAESARERETKKTESVVVQGGGNITIIENRPIIYQPPQVIHVEQNVVVKDEEKHWHRRDDFDDRKHHLVVRPQAPSRSSAGFAPNSLQQKSSPSSRTVPPAESR